MIQKKALAVLLAVGLLGVFGLGSARATRNDIGVAEASRFGTTVVGLDTGGVGSFGTGNLLYGFNVTVTTANSFASLYDTSSLTTATNTQGTYIDEGGAANIGETFKSDWPAPYKLKTGLSVVTLGHSATAGTNVWVTIYHDKTSSNQI